MTTNTYFTNVARSLCSPCMFPEAAGVHSHVAIYNSLIKTFNTSNDRAGRLHMALGNLLNSLSHDYHTDAIREAREAWERDK